MYKIKYINYSNESNASYILIQMLKEM